MQGKEKEQIVDLFPENPGYPWQVLEAEGETWLIVRWRRKVTSHPLKKIVSVSVKNFSGEIVYENRGKYFYQGEVSFQVSFNELEPQSPKTEFPESGEAVCREEYLFSEGLFKERKEDMEPYSERKNLSAETSFSTLLLAGDEINNINNNKEKGEKTCEVVLPWRCWLKGFGKNSPPVLKKVHIAQVGLYTLLLEALIKIEISTDGLLREDAELTRSVYEDRVFSCKEDSILEIMGMPVEVAFWRYSYDLRKSSLIIRAFKKTNLIYISSTKGGERFFFASDRGEEEEIIIKNCPKTIYPAGVLLGREQVETGLMEQNKILVQSKYLFHLYYQTPQRESLEGVAGTKKIAADAEKPPLRNRPGEKWLKKSKDFAKCKIKKVITIKPGNMS